VSGGRDALDFGGGGVGRAHRWENISDTAPSPEDLLLEREELDAAGLEEPAEPALPANRARYRQLLAQYLDQLSPEEREAVLLCVAGGHTHEQLAARAGLHKSGAQYRISRAKKRLKWLAGPGSSFTAEDVERLPCLTPDEARALATYWRTTSHSAVHRERLYASHAFAWRVIHGAIPKLPQPFRKGFEQLVAQGGLLLSGHEATPSALSVFVDRALRFGKGLSVAAVTLNASYERFARSSGRPWDLGTLRETVRARGGRVASVRVPWAREKVHGWRGVTLAGGHAAAP
jgi:hypothetical protein